MFSQFERYEIWRAVKDGLSMASLQGPFAPAGCDLRLEPAVDGWRLYLEAPIDAHHSIIDTSQKFIGIKTAEGRSLVFEYRLTSHQRALFELLPENQASTAIQDQCVCWVEAWEG